MARPSRRILPVLVAAGLCALAAGAGELPRMRLLTAEEGVYRVTHEDLVAAGLTAAAVDSGLPALSHRERSIPLWIDDGGDGVFGAGDSFEFVAEQLHGESSYYHPYSAHNVYWLSWDRVAARRVEQAPPTPPAGPPVRLVRKLHLESDQLLIRLGRDELGAGAPPDLWYWKKLSHADPQPLVIPIDFSDVDNETHDTVSVRVQLMGLSSQAEWAGRPPAWDHRVDVRLNGRPRGRWTWDGRTAQLAELPLFGAVQMEAAPGELALDVPRREDPEGQPIVDVVMLDWVEAEYPQNGSVGAEQRLLHVSPAANRGVVELTAAAERLVVFGDERTRRALSRAEGSFRFPAAGETRFWIVPDGRFLRPAAIEADRPSDLRSLDRQADYLILAHHSLLARTRELARFHAARGLAVELIDVQDVYDEFNHGIEDPLAIKSFIAHAFHNWRPPAPRYVLLVGDASWDTKNSTVDDANYANWTRRQLLDPGRFRARENPLYADRPQSNERNLIPTWSYASPEGHSASDNWFVSVAGDDPYPDLAIGRLPVVDEADLGAIIDKSIAYALDPPAGPWRRNVLWITNSSTAFKRRSDRLAEDLATRGFSAIKVFPGAGEALEEHQRTLQAAFDEGTFLVHFVGHGGRFIWQTGPPRLDSNTELFTLEHLDALAPSSRLPVVLSLTCHTGPFDHPNADSIGERFLRLAGRGAVAVVAASWRNQPTFPLSRAFVEEFTRPGTVGEAFVRAKRRLGDPDLIETYNLLGDPALPLALPAALE